MKICKFESCTNEVIPSRIKLNIEKIYCSESCKKKYHVNKLRRKKKTQGVEYLGGKCIRCGFNEHQAALQFHHRKPEEKSFSISSSNMSKNWGQLKEELKKCDLLCANCHAIHHAEEHKMGL